MIGSPCFLRGAVPPLKNYNYYIIISFQCQSKKAVFLSFFVALKGIEKSAADAV
jgi:hypothetical protein